MKIVSLQAENIKKLVAVEIKPDGNVVQITGKNGQGKTSVLDSIWWALAGLANIQSQPIRKGATSARIRLDLGEIIVTRTFHTGKDDEVISSIVVENDKGARFPSPQSMIDSLLGELSFDPLAFARADQKEQFDIMKKFVPDVDFDGIESQKADYFAKRTNINRLVKEARASVAGCTVENGPTEVVDESILVDDMEKAIKHNAQIETRKLKRDQVREKIDENDRQSEEIVTKSKEQAELLVRRVQSEVDNYVREAQARLRRAQEEAETAEKEATNRIALARKESADHIAQAQQTAKTLCDEAAELRKKLDDAPELPSNVDVSDIRKRIEEAKKINAGVNARRLKEARLKEAEKLEVESMRLTAAMETLETMKRKAISDAKLPIEGIAFGDGEILFGGFPLYQASDAEQLRVSISIAMALNPKLKVMRVRDGSLLDDDSMKLLTQMAEENDFQVWIERVDCSGKVGFILEDGHLKDAKVKAAAQAAG